MFWRNPLPNIDHKLQELLIDGREGKKEEEEEEFEGSDDDGGGWITPSNIKQILKELEQCDIPKDVQVGCVTADFTIQNVLLQMGLHMLAVNGMLVREARSYILSCHGCFKMTSDMNRAFCGHKTLKKVSVTINDDGTLHVHYSQSHKILNPRGLQYSLQLQKGANMPLTPI